MRGKLATGHCPVGCAALSLKDVCRVTSNSQLLADDRSGWRRAVREDREGRGTVQPTSGGQDTMKEAVTEMSGHRSIPYNRLGKDCYRRIGLLSHSKRCSPQEQFWPTEVLPLSFEIDGFLLLILTIIGHEDGHFNLRLLRSHREDRLHQEHHEDPTKKKINDFVPIIKLILLLSKHFI